MQAFRIPMVQTEGETRNAAAATCYPPRGGFRAARVAGRARAFSYPRATWINFGNTSLNTVPSPGFPKSK